MKRIENRERTILVWIVCLSVIARIVLVGVMARHGFDDQEEGQIARSLLNGQGYSYAGSPTAHKPPLYTLILTLCFLPFPSEWKSIPYNPAQVYSAHLVDQALKIVVAALTIIILYQLGKKVFGTTAGLVGAFLLAFNPLLVVQILFPGHMPYDMLLFTALLLCVVQLVHNPTRKTILIYGLLSAITILENPVILAFVLLAQIWLFCWGLQNHSWKIRLQFLALPFLFMLIAVAPWTYRNDVVFHRFVPLTSNYPLELWFGNNDLATGGFYKGPAPQASLPAGSEIMNEVQRNQALGKQAITYIRNHPLRALKLRVLSAYYFWFGSWRFSGFPPIVTQTWFALNLFLTILAFAGIVLACRETFHKNVPLLLMIVGIFVPYILTHGGDDRYRAGLMPLMMLYLAFLLIRLYNRLYIFIRR